MKKILVIMGTRPEAIKLCPLILKMKANPYFEVKVCNTAQHKEQMDAVLDFFEIVPDYNLGLMQPNQSLFQLTANALLKLEPVLDETKPDLVIVQGDTTTVLSGALSAFYKKVKIAHVEAGLRSTDLYSPFPEEANRVLTSRITDFHFVPTCKAKVNLEEENIHKNVYLVGNTVIDALEIGLEKLNNNRGHYKEQLKSVDFSKRIVLVTCHRRESFGEPFLHICNALLKLAQQNEDIQIVYPVHLNPNIQKVANEVLKHERILLIKPLDYPSIIKLMERSYLILTDSGGIQEEAPTLGKPVLVLRDVTERTEGVEAGTALMVGTDTGKIINTTQQFLDDPNFYENTAKRTNPYGDGTTCQQIIEILQREL
jgi:UDP-N-acetylglucosamine 2-epimerase (non-hydrolysing)